MEDFVLHLSGGAAPAYAVLPMALERAGVDDLDHHLPEASTRTLRRIFVIVATEHFVEQSGQVTPLVARPQAVWLHDEDVARRAPPAREACEVVGSKAGLSQRVQDRRHHLRLCQLFPREAHAPRSTHELEARNVL